MKYFIILLVAGLSSVSCKNDCEELASKVCKRTGDDSRVCAHAKRTADNPGKYTLQKCRVTLKAGEIMEKLQGTDKFWE